MSPIRIRFAKLGKIRWTSHRDVARMWERAFRRVELPLAYSAGFSPRPKVSFGLALPTGHESLAEYLDVELAPEADVDVRSLPERLSAALPLGVEVTAAEPIAPGTPSLQEDVTSCTWQWVVAPPAGAGTPPPPLRSDWAEELEARVAAVLAAPAVVVTLTRKGQEQVEDIRGAIHTLQLLGPAGPDLSHGMQFEAELGCRPRTLRPAEVQAALAPDFEVCDVRRTHQWILRDGARREPLLEAFAPGATGAPRALERV